MPQLMMWFRRFDRLPPLALPDGVSLRRFAPGDEAAWAEVLNANGELGEWDLARAQKAIVGEGATGVFGPGIHLIESVPERRVLATACVQQRAEAPEEPELGWVAARPEVRGRGLGYLASLAVLHFMRQRGVERCFLRTDDRRLPALKLYLQLGFEPDMSDPSYPARWAAIWRQLYESGTGASGLSR